MRKERPLRSFLSMHIVCQEENNLENSNPTKTSIACKYKLLLANQYARMINLVNQFLTIEA